MCVCGCVGGELKINLIMATEKEGKRERERWRDTPTHSQRERKIESSHLHSLISEIAARIYIFEICKWVGVKVRQSRSAALK